MRNRLLGAGLALLSGCTTIVAHTPSGETLEMTPEAFTRYVEQVYRQQSRVTGQLIRAVGNFSEEDIDEDQPLAVAARRMAKACEPFSELVAERVLAELTGAPIDPALVDAVPACEAAAGQLEAALP